MIFSLPTLGAAALLSALAIVAAAPALADQPAQTAPVHGKADGSADNAVKRGSAPAAIAARAADRAHCRELAAKRRLFGLGRHKFLQRCRRARRKAASTPPAPGQRQHP